MPAIPSLTSSEHSSPSPRLQLSPSTPSYRTVHLFCLNLLPTKTNMNSFEIRFTCISYIDIQENTKNLYTNVIFSFSFWGTVPHIPYKGFPTGPHWRTSIPRSLQLGPLKHSWICPWDFWRRALVPHGDHAPLEF